MSSEIILGFTPRGGKPVFDNPDDLYKYCIEKEGIHQTAKIKGTAFYSEKEAMYAFIFGPLMECAVRGFTAAGYNGIDKVKARYILEAEFCKENIYNPVKDKIMVRTEHVGGMSKARLLKYIVDIIFFLELELGVTPPDAEEYKMRLKTGKGIKRIN